MVTFELSNRLKTCLVYLAGIEKIADIGTDHAYLPCYGILNGFLKTAIAADVVEGPLKMAAKTIEKYNLTNNVELRLGSGLSILSPGEVNGVVIAGMGGKLISSLIEADLEVAKSMKRLVLQANVDAAHLREALMGWGFEITAESIILEDGKYYEIMVAQPVMNPVTYSDLELAFGPALLKNVHEKAFQNYWRYRLLKQEAILSRLPSGHPKFETVRQRIHQIKGVLKDD